MTTIMQDAETLAVSLQRQGFRVHRPAQPHPTLIHADRDGVVFYAEGVCGRVCVSLDDAERGIHGTATAASMYDALNYAMGHARVHNNPAWEWAREVLADLATSYRATE
jgi:hypothetical protein